MKKITCDVCLRDITHMTYKIKYKQSEIRGGGEKKYKLKWDVCGECHNMLVGIFTRKDARNDT